MGCERFTAKKWLCGRDGPVMLDTNLLSNAVAEALSEHGCVSAWLGIGNALFLGFGTEPIAPRDAEGRRTVPPYELQTDMASWRLVGGASVSSNAERGPAERAVEGLVGRPVVDWRLRGGRGLEVEFVDGWILEVVPPGEPDPDWPDSEEWWFNLPGSRFVGVGSGGRVVAGSTSSEDRTPEL
jgi:hypothetical protein